jgi:16S rRNA A1518/A1519 N6-dimethyltransferase RsmA/KsgA/DIM1 with predicted DNA glycosylase/AP lyase activity
MKITLEKHMHLIILILSLYIGAHYTVNLLTPPFCPSFLAFKAQADKGTRAMYEIKKKKYHNLSVWCQIEVFDKVVKSIVLYGSDVWGFNY